MTGLVAAAVAAFLCGAIPTGYLVARARGVDIRSVGSGNIGATNVVRALGWRWGIATLAVDILKGAIPVLCFPGWAEQWASSGAQPWIAPACAAAAVAGHNWTPFLGFRGGKGVATGAGAMLALTPWAVAASVGMFAAVFAAARYVSASSLAAALALPVWAMLFDGRPPVVALATALAVVTVWTHRANIRRLLRGEEHRVGGKRS